MDCKAIDNTILLQKNILINKTTEKKEIFFLSLNNVTKTANIISRVWVNTEH